MADAFTCDVCGRVVKTHRGASDTAGTVTVRPEIHPHGSERQIWPDQVVSWTISPGRNVSHIGPDYDVCKSCRSVILMAAAEEETPR